MFNINKRPSNKHLIEKAAMMLSDLSDGGKLQADQSGNFIRGVIEDSPLLNMCDAFSMAKPEKRIDKLSIDSHVLRGTAASFDGTDVESNPLLATEQTVPTGKSTLLTTNEFVGEIQISYDALEDNVEEGGLKNTLETLLFQAATRDCEEIVLMSTGDVDSVASSYDPFELGSLTTAPGDDPLNVVNGLIQNCASDSYTITAAGGGATGFGLHYGSHSVSPVDVGVPTYYDDISIDWLGKLKASIPSKYIRNPNDFVFLTNNILDMNIRKSLVTRTTNLGDSVLQGYDANVIYGSRVVPIPMWGGYTNQTDGSTATVPTEENTWVIYMNPKNLAVGFHRDISIETDKDVRARKFIIVLTLRFGWVVKEYDAVGILENMVS